MIITVEMVIGISAKQTVKLAQRLAKQLDIMVTYKFNNTEVLVNKHGVVYAFDKNNQADEMFYHLD